MGTPPPARVPGFEVVRTRKEPSGNADDDDCQQSGDQETGEARPVIALQEEHEGNDERPHSRPRLVERFIDAEHPAAAQLLAGKRQHCFCRRFADRAAGSLGHNQASRQRPIARECEGRHREHVDHIAGNRHQPVFAGLVAQIAGDGAKGVANQLAEPRCEPHHGGAGSEGGEERPCHAPCPLVSHVGEKIGNADNQHKSERRSRRECLGLIHKPLVATRVGRELGEVVDAQLLP